MTKKQVLDFKPAPRLEQVDAEHSERMQEREPRPRSCDDSTQRCDSHAGWDFRKGQETANNYFIFTDAGSNCQVSASTFFAAERSSFC